MAKACNPIRPDALLTALQRFGVPGPFSHMVQKFYKNRTFLVQDAGARSRWHPQHAGVCQGCSLSPFLVVIPMTVLIHDARAELSVRSGKPSHNECLGEILYADDTLLVDTHGGVAEEYMRCVSDVGLEYVLASSPGKTEVMCCRCNDRIRTHGKYIHKCHLLRTVPPQQVAPYATAHDQRMHMEFRRLLGLASTEHDAVLHGLFEEIWARQAKMPVRMGGFGLRDSIRTAPAAYWASWADCLHSLHEWCPRLGHVILNALTAAESQGPVAQGIPQRILAAVCAGQALEALGMQARPSWRALCEGAPPPSADAPDRVPGEWQQGWQHSASSVCEQREYESMLRTLTATSAAGPLLGRARLRSCSGPYAGGWLTTCPSTGQLRFTNSEMWCAL